MRTGIRAGHECLRYAHITIPALVYAIIGPCRSGSLHVYGLNRRSPWRTNIISFDQARVIVEQARLGKALSIGYTILSWGYEDDTRYRVIAGSAEVLIEGRVELAPVDWPVIFVDKSNGKITEATYLDVMAELAAMRPVGIGAPPGS